MPPFLLARTVDPASRDALGRWYTQHRRDLDWRRTRDPYAIWVSEVMLQQTRVAVATRYHRRWMAALPTLQALAKAPEQVVLRLWAGLGYYARARRLREAAQVVVERHGGRLPESVQELEQLPGFGPYTAAAVASIAFGQRVAAVDGNVERVVCRIAGFDGDPRRGTLRARVRDVAGSWLPRSGCGDWNQAMMELGATVCTPRAPRCATCPVASACASRRDGKAPLRPPPQSRRTVKERVHFAAVRRGGKLLLVRRGPGLLGGLWGLPGGAVGEDLAALVRKQAGIEVRLDAQAGEFRHAFTGRTWLGRVHGARFVRACRAPAVLETRWVPAADVHRQGLPSAMRAALAAGVRA